MRHKNTEAKRRPKIRWLLYIVIVVVLLFVGFTVYYFVRNNEDYIYSLDNGGALHINAGESADLPVVVKKQNSHTTITVTVNDENGSPDNSVVLYDQSTNKLVSVGDEIGGTAYVVITSTNKDFHTFSFSVWVGNGTAANPWFIKSKEQFESIGDEGSKFMAHQNYLLECSIDFGGAELEPIQNFEGSFSGGQNVLQNFCITGSGQNAGVFASVAQGGVVEQIIVENATISGEFDNVGVVAGKNEGVVKKCIVQGCMITSTKPESNVGGVVGFVGRGDDGERSYVQICSAKMCQISGASCGGIVGKNISGVIFDCHSASTLNGDVCTGGIVGSVENDKNQNLHSVIKNCLSVDKFAQNATNCGHIVGISTDKKVAASGKFVCQLIDNYFVPHNNISATSTTSALLCASCEQVSAADLYDSAKLEKLNYDSVWSNNDNQVETYLNVLEASEQPINFYEYGDKISSASYLIEVIKRMMNESGNDAKKMSYEITADITADFGGYVGKPIGSKLDPFSGVFKVADGKKVTIKNLTIDCTGCEYGGLFGFVFGADSFISGINLENCTIKTKDATYVGAFVGCVRQGFVENCKVGETCTIDGGMVVGGFVGLCEGTITNCKTACSINFISQKSISLGGFCGKNAGNISDSLSSAYIEVSSSKSMTAGGMVGINYGKLTNSIVSSLSANLASESDIYAGFLAGRNEGLMSKSASSNCSLKCVAAGTDRVGGLFGADASAAQTLQCAASGGEIDGDNVAGFAGVLHGYVSECYSSSQLTGKNTSGFAHLASGHLKNCYNKNVMYSKETVSGIICDFANGLKIQNCYVGSSIASFDGETVHMMSGDFLYKMNRSFYQNSKLLYENNIVNEQTFYYEGAKIAAGQWSEYRQLYSRKYHSINSEILTATEVELFVNGLKYDTNIWSIDVGSLPKLKACEYNYETIDGTKLLISQTETE